MLHQRAACPAQAGRHLVSAGPICASTLHAPSRTRPTHTAHLMLLLPTLSQANPTATAVHGA
eukprot:363941-Chlamydomonas_euryale.AAC.11